VARRRAAAERHPVVHKGLTIVYIGDGKGKTTAAVGIATRAAGWGYRVAFLQFVKGTWPSGERKSLPKLGVMVKTMGKGFVKIRGDKQPMRVHRVAATKAFAEAKRVLRSKHYDVVICDEAISAVETKVATQAQVMSLIAAKPAKIHLVLTGHDKFPQILKKADLVTEMKKLNHPYDRGTLAQKGIDF
jgi:cob(I)alamin adenosyltransferase